jgi:hypothetical protein
MRIGLRCAPSLSLSLSLSSAVNSRRPTAARARGSACVPSLTGVAGSAQCAGRSRPRSSSGRGRTAPRCRRCSGALCCGPPCRASTLPSTDPIRPSALCFPLLRPQACFLLCRLRSSTQLSLPLSSHSTFDHCFTVVPPLLLFIACSYLAMTASRSSSLPSVLTHLLQM